MADTLNEIAYNLLNKIEGGRSHNNTYYSLDQIKFNIENYRSLFLRRDLRDSHDLYMFEQSLTIPMTRDVKQVDMRGNITYVLKSSKEIPQFIRAKHQIPLTVIHERSGEVFPVTYGYIRFFSEYNKYSKNKPVCHIHGGILYIHRDDMSKVISGITDNEDAQDVNEVTLNGVFEKPTEAMIFNGIDPVDVGSQPYPITKDLTQRITEGLINGELQMIMQSPNDTKHNTLPDHQLG